MTEKQPKQQTNTVYLSFNAVLDTVALSEGNAGHADTGKPVRFSGVAYSGDVLHGHWKWGSFVLDIASMSHNSKVGLLEEHNPYSRVGVVDSIDKGSDVSVSAYMLQGEQRADELSNQLKQGFPFELSLATNPRSALTYTVPFVANGRTVEASEAFPVTLLLGCRIREVSLVTSGWDEATSTSIEASAAGVSKDTSGQEAVDQGGDTVNLGNDEMTNEELQAKVADLTSKLEAATTELAGIKLSERNAKVAALAIKLSATPEEQEAWKAMSDEAFAAFHAVASRIELSGNSAIAGVLTADLNLSANGGEGGDTKPTGSAILSRF